MKVAPPHPEAGRHQPGAGARGVIFLWGCTPMRVVTPLPPAEVRRLVEGFDGDGEGLAAAEASRPDAAVATAPAEGVEEGG
jgi:hypothetical protein